MILKTNGVNSIIAGNNPLEYSYSAPYSLFLFQAILIISTCQIIAYPIHHLRQPKVIAEVIAGIFLGPSVLGHIPGFTETCFPEASIPGLVLLSSLGVILFLFVMGLEVDLNFIKKDIKVVASVVFMNMGIPFALGCGIAKSLYTSYVFDESNSIDFTTYMIFIAVAMSITALPVLASILVELDLTNSKVGNIVLAAGITNDLVGWILLALVVTLASSGNKINTFYLILLTLGWFGFLLYPVKTFLKYILTSFTNDLTTGNPSHLSVVLIFILVFISAFYTDIIGVHPFFGAFMVGIIVPRDNGYVLRISQKIEDLIHIIFLPIYFAVAGLNVNLGLLNTAIDWGYTIALISLAMLGKIIGGFFGARINGINNREALAVGVLMSCKGIVEIVVLSVGMNANIISDRVYSMLILMTLVTTFSTTPLTMWVYPKRESEPRDKKPA